MRRTARLCLLAAGAVCQTVLLPRSQPTPRPPPSIRSRPPGRHGELADPTIGALITASLSALSSDADGAHVAYVGDEVSRARSSTVTPADFSAASILPIMTAACSAAPLRLTMPMKR